MSTALDGPAVFVLKDGGKHEISVRNPPNKEKLLPLFYRIDTRANDHYLRFYFDIVTDEEETTFTKHPLTCGGLIFFQKSSLKIIEFPAKQLAVHFWETVDFLLPLQIAADSDTHSLLIRFRSEEEKEPITDVTDEFEMVVIATWNKVGIIALQIIPNPLLSS